MQLRLVHHNRKATYRRPLNICCNDWTETNVDAGYHPTAPLQAMQSDAHELNVLVKGPFRLTSGKARAGKASGVISAGRMRLPRDGYAHAALAWGVVTYMKGLRRRANLTRRMPPLKEGYA